MVCKKYASMLPEEQKIFIGELVHAAINSNTCFVAANEIIQLAKLQGKFIGVTIGVNNTKLYDNRKNEKNKPSF